MSSRHTTDSTTWLSKGMSHITTVSQRTTSRSRLTSRLSNRSATSHRYQQRPLLSRSTKILHPLSGVVSSPVVISCAGGNLRGVLCAKEKEARGRGRHITRNHCADKRGAPASAPARGPSRRSG
jgi:hypothetical protein